MSEPIPFRLLQLDDKHLVQRYTFQTTCRNCDLNFMNLCSWQFRYHTEVAEWNGWLVFRFYADGHLAYMLPLGSGRLDEVLQAMRADAQQMGHPFLMLGVCECFLGDLDRALPGYFNFVNHRAYSDYVYDRESLATLAGKKLQPKRNHVNRFFRTYPSAEYRDLTSDLIPACMALEQRWMEQKEGYADNPVYAEERRSMAFVFKHWNELDGRGGALFVDGNMVAFTYGAPINHDTFDVCVEKADVNYEGAFAAINREFVRRLPGQFTLVNREEDLGVEGLRKAKESYQPAFLLHKHAAMAKRPLEEEHG